MVMKRGDAQCCSNGVLLFACAQAVGLNTLFKAAFIYQQNYSLVLFTVPICYELCLFPKAPAKV